jgi:hypothetical protein
MRLIANLINEIGRGFQRRGSYSAAEFWYSAATRLSPSWAVPWFNRGLIAKFGHRWQDSYRFNINATKLDQGFMPAWWNLGIAATALGNWTAARCAWSIYGVKVPPGDGPLDMALGGVPIRIDPAGAAEVVWCDRLDPARARIVSIPFPASGRGYGDVLLTDGEPRGYRMLQRKQVPVFNELEVLSISDLSTFAISLSAPNREAIQFLSELAASREIPMEDWSASIEVLCRKCSEGVPHSHEVQRQDSEWKATRHIGIVAANSHQAESILNEWLAADSARSVAEMECVLQR